MNLEEALVQLARLDAAIRNLDTGDTGRLSVHLAERAELVQAAASEIARLRGEAQAIPAGTREALERSSSAGMHGMRQLILAKHMLATELGKLKQEQRLFDALTYGEAPVRPRLEISA